MSETKGAIWKEAKHPRRSLPPMVGHARPAPSNAHTRSRVESPRGLVVGSLHVDSKKVGDKPSVCTRYTRTRYILDDNPYPLLYFCREKPRESILLSTTRYFFFFLPLTLSTIDRAIFFPRRNPSDDASFGILERLIEIRRWKIFGASFLFDRTLFEEFAARLASSLMLDSGFIFIYIYTVLLSPRSESRLILRSTKFVSVRPLVGVNARRTICNTPLHGVFSN